MNKPLEDITEQALKLSDIEREWLTQRLLASLEAEAGIAEAWTAEAERRLAAIDSGEMSLHPLEPALEQLRNELK